MALQLEHLNEEVRTLMAEEIEMDVQSGNLYMSPRLGPMGRDAYPYLLKRAALKTDPVWLVEQLHTDGYLNETEPHANAKDKQAKMPENAAETLAEGEFNRYYMRAVCRYALAHGEKEVEIYRAKETEHPRTVSERLIGQRVSAETLLADLRAEDFGAHHALLPTGPNSGLSIRLVK